MIFVGKTGLEGPRRLPKGQVMPADLNRRQPPKPMAELVTHLGALRADLVERMTGELAAEGAWQAGLPLLAQIETALQAVEAVMEEGSRE